MGQYQLWLDNDYELLKNMVYGEEKVRFYTIFLILNFIQCLFIQCDDFFNPNYCSKNVHKLIL